MRSVLTRFALCGLTASLAVAVADALGVVATTDAPWEGFTFAAVFGSLGASAAFGIVAGLLAGGLVLLAGLSSPASILGRELTRAAGSLAGLVVGSIAFCVPLAVAVPARASLLEQRPRLAALVGVLALTLGAACFALAHRFAGRRWPRSPRWRRVGVTGALLALAVAAAGVVWRPILAPMGVLDLLQIGLIGIAAASAYVLLPQPGRTSHVVLSVGALVASSALAFAQSSSELRSGIASELRPSRWVIVETPRLIDLDGDGYSALFGGGDCDDFDRARNPEAPEIPGNGIDDNCRDGDKAIRHPFRPRPSFVALPPSVAEPQVVLLVVVDTLRADHVSAYGYSKETTPNIDALAGRSVLFRRAYSAAPTTRLAMPMLMTGRFLSEIRWNRNLWPWGITRENNTVAEAFRTAGYRTAAFITSYVFREPWGFTQGFDHVDDSQAFDRAHIYDGITSPALVDRFLSWMGRHRSEKVFAWVHFLDPHNHYMPHPGGPDFGSDAVGLYDGEIFFTDREIGRLLEGLRRMGLEQKTAIALLADHGELFGEHGSRVHGGALWEEVLRIPLIFHVPGIAPKEVPCVTSHVDVGPTLLNLAGVDPARHGFSGATLVGDLSGQCDSEREMVSEIRHHGERRTLVGPRYKFVEDPGHGSGELYDLRADPREARNLVREQPRVAGTMRDRLNAWHEYYVSRDVSLALAEAVVDELPDSAQPLRVEFPNGIEFLGMDLGTRRMDINHSLRVALYLRTRRRVSSDCRVWTEFSRGKRRAKLVGQGSHVPVGGLLPLRYFPPGRLVEDVFHLRWGWQHGRMTGRAGLWCDGHQLPARPGPDVNEDGWVRLGSIRVARPPSPRPGDPAEQATKED